jgi:hypothetical protein
MAPHLPNIDKAFTDVSKLDATGANWMLFDLRVERATTATSTQNWLTTKIDPSASAEEKLQEAQLLNAILGKLPDELMLKFRLHKTVSKLWAALKADFENKSQVATALLERELHTSKCQDHEDLCKHIDHLNNIRAQLAQRSMTLNNAAFTRVIVASLPPTYSQVATALQAITSVVKLTSDSLIAALHTKYDTRAANKPKKNKLDGATALAAGASRGRTNSHGRGRGRGNGQNDGRGQGRGQDSNWRCRSD